MTLVATSGVMPVFLLGAVAPLLRADLNLSSGDVGLATFLFFVGSATASAWTGRRTDRFGPWRAMRAGTMTSGGVLVGIALLVDDLPSLAIACAVGGMVNGLQEPATNAALAGLRSRRTGLVFGTKMAAIPLAALLAGASVPLVGVRIGWRPAFLAASALPVILLVSISSRSTAPAAVGRPTSTRGPGRSSASLILLAVACGLGTAGATALSTHLTLSAEAIGMPVGRAGWLLTACGLAGVAMRAGVGWAVDRTEGSVLTRIATMLAVGAAGYLLLAVRSELTFSVGAVIVYGFGWGWGGLLMYCVVRLHPEAPARATGVIATGLGSGAAIGPLAIGQVIESSSHAVAWALAAAAVGLGALLVLLARDGLRRALEQPPTGSETHRSVT